MKGKAAIRRREQDQLAFLAWHIEALSRTSKMPRLEDMLHAKPKADEALPDQETLAAKIKLAFGYPGDTTQ
jgi:hypothetical protein